MTSQTCKKGVFVQGSLKARGPDPIQGRSSAAVLWEGRTGEQSLVLRLVDGRRAGPLQEGGRETVAKEVQWKALDQVDMVNSSHTVL